MNAWTLIDIPNLPPSIPRTIEVPPPDGLRLDRALWWTFAAGETDALVVGERLAIWRVLTSVWPTLRKPRFWCESRGLGVNLRTYREGTLILQNVHELQGDGQRRLLEWCEGQQPRSRIISTASGELVTLVEEGAFDQSLYNRLKPAQLVLR